MEIKLYNFWKKDILNLKTFTLLEIGLYETCKNWQFCITLINLRIDFII